MAWGFQREVARVTWRMLRVTWQLLRDKWAVVFMWNMLTMGVCVVMIGRAKHFPSNHLVCLFDCRVYSLSRDKYSWSSSTSYTWNLSWSHSENRLVVKSRCHIVKLVVKLTNTPNKTWKVYKYLGASSRHVLMAENRHELSNHRTLDIVEVSQKLQLLN